jgi:hypothetical protein
MRTNATIISIFRPPAVTEPHAIRCLFTGATLVDQGGSAATLTGTLLIPHHELVRDTPSPPHAYPKVGDSVTLRLDSRSSLEFGDDIIYVIETARGVPGGPLKHWHFTLKSP